jgi:hypothetical protein
MKTKYKTPTKGTVPKSNKKIVEKEEKSITLTHIYMIVHLHGLVQALLIIIDDKVT